MNGENDANRSRSEGNGGGLGRMGWGLRRLLWSTYLQAKAVMGTASSLLMQAHYQQWIAKFNCQLVGKEWCNKGSSAPSSCFRYLLLCAANSLPNSNKYWITASAATSHIVPTDQVSMTMKPVDNVSIVLPRTASNLCILMDFEGYYVQVQNDSHKLFNRDHDLLSLSMTDKVLYVLDRS